MRLSVRVSAREERKKSERMKRTRKDEIEVN